MDRRVWNGAAQEWKRDRQTRSKCKKVEWKTSKYSRTIDIDMTTARCIGKTWSEACSNDSLPDHLLVSFVYISEYVGSWSVCLRVFFSLSLSLFRRRFQSKPITMFRFAAVDLVLCTFFLLLHSWCMQQVNSRNVCIFPRQCCALLAVYANDIVDQLRWRQTTTI